MDNSRSLPVRLGSKGGLSEAFGEPKTKMKTMKMGTYVRNENGKLVHSSTLKKYKEVKKNLLCVATLAVFASLTITNEIYIEAKGAAVEDMAIKAAEPEAPHEEAKSMTVEEQIRAIAKEQDFKWPDYLVRLAKCESTLNPSAINDKNRNGSIDWGLFQWNSELPPLPITKECAMDLECSTLMTIKAINAGMQDHWVCNERALNK